MVSGKLKVTFGTNQNQMQHTWPFYIVAIFKVLKVLLIKTCKIQPPDLLLLVLLAFASPTTDIIFHKFLELHSKLSEKKIFVINFPFLMDSLKSPTS